MKLTRNAALSFTLIALAACGGSSTPSSTPTTSPPGETTSPPASGEALVMKDFMFEPKDFTLASGARITIRNEGAAEHNLTVEGQEFSKDVSPGETETEDLELPAGSYTIFCRFHRSQGMEGTLTITG
jgi:plastocyanin